VVWPKLGLRPGEENLRKLY